jgi:hypothetical protein
MSKVYWFGGSPLKRAHCVTNRNHVALCGAWPWAGWDLVESDKPQCARCREELEKLEKKFTETK